MNDEDRSLTETAYVEENEVPNLYRMEMNRGYFNSPTENKTISSPEVNESNQSPSGNLHESVENERSFNSWKTKNRIMGKSHLTEHRPDMISNLGKTLENWKHVIPSNSPQHNGYNLHEERMNQFSFTNKNPAGPLNSFDQQEVGYPSEMHNNPNNYIRTDNMQMPVNFAADHNLHPNRINGMYQSPLQLHKRRDMSKPKLQYMHEMKEKYSKNPYMYNPYFSPVAYGPPMNPHMINRENSYQEIDHYHGVPVNYQYQTFNESNGAHNCLPYFGNKNSKEKKRKKNETIKNKQISDLYRIVYLQNQQLGLLQKQVQKLIELNSKDEKFSSTPQECATVLNKKIVKGTEKRTFNLSVIKENENLEKKVSVGIMTSFVENNYTKMNSDREIIKVSPKRGKSKIHNSDEETSESTSDEDDEPNASKSRVANDDNISFNLNDVQLPDNVENVPSPETSFHLEMQEYRSSSSSSESCSESSSSDNEADSPPVGWTFYDTVVDKVNDMLKIPAEDKDNDSDEDDVRNATINQLRQLGVSFVDTESPTTKRVTFNNRNIKTKLTSKQQLQYDSETSLHMNALANKYLKGCPIPSAGPLSETPQKSNNNLSHATLRYLERYQLSPNDSKENEQKKDVSKKKSKKKIKNENILKGIEKNPSLQSKCGKILDITAIKKQPKLLPKK